MATRETCPKCRRIQYWTCGNKNCQCVQSVPKGKKAQINLKNDIVKCPYCGFKAHMDYWQEREWRAYEKLVNAGRKRKPKPKRPRRKPATAPDVGAEYFQRGEEIP